MKFKILLLLLCAVPLISCSSVSSSTPDNINGLPLHVKKLSDNAIRLWVGDYISSTAVSALNTDNGIVVIDTTECPILDKHFRKIIAQEFGRDDFTHLINTHEHADHTTGNSIYADCEIIAHEYAAQGMQTQRDNKQRILDWYEKFIPEKEAELAGLEKGTDEYKQAKEDLIVRKMRQESLLAGHELKLPTKTFTDTMTIDMGNMTLELFAAGGTHTASDIFIFVPQEGLLFTGDMMADKWLTDTPGCLQAFRMGQGTKRDMPLLLKNWESLIARKGEIRDYVPGHWNGDLSEQGFIDRYNYTKAMYDGINEAAGNGDKLDSLFARFDMETRFPNLKDTPGFTRADVHNGSILALWSDATGAVSATTKLAEMIDAGDIDKAIAKMQKAHAAGSDKFFFLEGDLNRLGYQYLTQEKYDAAIAVFKLTADIYPDSWNVYDSLAEGYMNNGQYELAVNNYNRSIELNPDNDNGKRMLEQINTTLAKK